MLNYIPLVRFLIPFILGIISAVYFPSKNYIPLYLFVGLLLCYVVLLLVKKTNSSYQYRWVFGVLLYSMFLVGGHALTSFKKNAAALPTKELSQSGSRFIVAEITAPIEEKENSVKAIVNVSGIKTDDAWKASQGKSIIYFEKSEKALTLKSGDIISFEPILKDVPPPKNPNEFDFKRYLSYHLIHQQAYLKSTNWKLIQKAENSSLIATAHQIRKNLIAKLNELGVKDEQLAVASALILGYKNDIDAQLQSAYSSAGAMHVLAVSGLHVGVIFILLNFIFGFLDKWKWGVYFKGALIISCLWVYALITGLSPSVMRAATMFSFLVAAKTTKSNHVFFNTMAASALFLLIINPYLLMEVGFQLSYLAVIGIVVIHPYIYHLLYVKHWFLDKIWNITAVSIAAQIATFPLGLYYFHQFPNYFIFSNLIVIPAGIAILYGGIVTLILSEVPVLNEWLGQLLNWIVFGLNKAVLYIEQLPYALTENIKFTLLDNYLTYLAIVLILVALAYKKLSYILWATVCFILLFGFRLWDKTQQVQQRHLVVYNIPQHSAINLIEGKDNVLISDIQLYESKNKMLFHVQNNWIQHGVENEKIFPLKNLSKQFQVSTLHKVSNEQLFFKRNYISFLDKRMVILFPDAKLNPIEQPLNLDFLIVTQNPYFSLEEILKTYQPKQVILDASNSFYTVKKFQEAAKKLNINLWAVPTDGAFNYSF